MVLNPAARLRSTVIGLFWEMGQINVGSLREYGLTRKYFILASILGEVVCVNGDVHL